MSSSNLKKHLPTSPGVYLMKNAAGKILYVGKAGNLKRRVLSYFQRPQEYRITRMISEVARIDTQKTDTVIEALMLEARLIKKYQPPYNVLEKDDKSFLYVVIPRETFPRVLALREKESLAYHRPLGYFGPFTSGSAVREALHILRRIFPYNIHDLQPSLRGAPQSGATKQSHSNVRLPRARLRSALAMTNPHKPCFNYHIGLCPGTCAGLITPKDYRKIVRHITLFFQGKKRRILAQLKNEMRALAKNLRYEEAAAIRRRIAALEHIRDVAVLRESKGERSAIHRIEGYDISNISGTSAVGSMVVFTDGAPDKSQYRKFRIKTVQGSNDVGMLTEVLTRRFSRHRPYKMRRSTHLVQHEASWPMPDIVLIDGGLPQVNAARQALKRLWITIPVIGIAKGPERKRNDFLYPPEIHELVAANRDMLVRVRDEAHRFAVRYHRELRGRNSMS